MARALAEEFPPMRPHTAAGWIVAATAERFDIHAVAILTPSGPEFGLDFSANTMRASFTSKTKHLAAVTAKLFQTGSISDRWAALDDVAASRQVIRGFMTSDWSIADQALSELASRGWADTLRVICPRVMAIAALAPPAGLIAPQKKPQR